MRVLFLLILFFVNVLEGNCESTVAPPQAQSQLEGTLFFMKDAKGKPKSFSIKAGIAGETVPSEITRLKQVLFIKAQNKIYVAYNPTEDSRQILLNLMEEFHVKFINDLEGKRVKFETTTETANLEEPTPATEMGFARRKLLKKTTSYPIAKIILEEGSITRTARNQLLNTLEDLGIQPD